MTRRSAWVSALFVVAALAGCASKPGFETREAAIRIYDDGHIFWQGAFKRVDYEKFLDRGLLPQDVRDLRIRNSPGGELSVVTKLRELVATHDSRSASRASVRPGAH